MPKQSKRPAWVSRAGRRQLTPQEADKVERKRVDDEMARKRSVIRRARAKKLESVPKPKQKPWHKRYNPFDVLATGALRKKD